MLKACRRRVLAGIRLYGELHRFVPIFAAWQGARVTEQVVNPRPRTAGKTTVMDRSRLQIGDPPMVVAWSLRSRSIGECRQQRLSSTG